MTCGRHRMPPDEPLAELRMVKQNFS